MISMSPTFEHINLLAVKFTITHLTLLKISAYAHGSWHYATLKGNNSWVGCSMKALLIHLNKEERIHTCIDTPITE